MENTLTLACIPIRFIFGKGMRGFWIALFLCGLGSGPLCAAKKLIYAGGDRMAWVWDPPPRTIILIGVAAPLALEIYDGKSYLAVAELGVASAALVLDGYAASSSFRKPPNVLRGFSYAALIGVGLLHVGYPIHALMQGTRDGDAARVGRSLAVAGFNGFFLMDALTTAIWDPPVRHSHGLDHDFRWAPLLGNAPGLVVQKEF